MADEMDIWLAGLLADKLAEKMVNLWAEMRVVE